MRKVYVGIDFMVGGKSMFVMIGLVCYILINFINLIVCIVWIIKIVIWWVVIM